MERCMLMTLIGGVVWDDDVSIRVLWFPWMLEAPKNPSLDLQEILNSIVPI
jgi:hypothetical protein